MPAHSTVNVLYSTSTEYYSVQRKPVESSGVLEICERFLYICLLATVNWPEATPYANIAHHSTPSYCTYNVKSFYMNQEAISEENPVLNANSKYFVTLFSTDKHLVAA